MGLRKTYIQQLHFDGENYTKSEVIDLMEKWGIYCDVPFKLFPEAKELPYRDWAGEDGRDVYVPKKIPLAAYELEVEVTYKGEDGKMYLPHTLNNTVVAPPRMLIAYLENHLQADGSVTIADVLVPYMGGTTVLIPKK